jgi:hypothetical protein
LHANCEYHECGTVTNILHPITLAFVIQHVGECSVKIQNEHKLCWINVLKCLAVRLGIMTKTNLASAGMSQRNEEEMWKIIISWQQSK